MEKIDLTNFKKAFETLKQAFKLLASSNDSYLKELKMNNIFRYRQGYEIMPNWQNWELYNEKRNSTSHEYNIEKARESLNIIHRFIIDVEILIKNMEIYYND